MYRIILIAFAISLLPAVKVAAQTCSNLGQNPGTAFPVCGTDTFVQGSVPLCGGSQIPGPCPNDFLTDINPYWYKFTCFSAGTLGFVISPVNKNDDYDWQLFDVTNKNPADVYTDGSMFVACDWSGESGNTGASSAGNSLQRCGGYGIPLFTSMPTLQLGHQYILLISHFAGDSQSGYSLTFGGGTTSITDPLDPHLLAARAACDGTSISVKLNKKMKCSSLQAEGSGFVLMPAIAPIVSATGVGCSTSFDLDSVVLNLGSALPPGNYKVTVNPIQNLLDNCDKMLPSTDTLDVTVYPLIATPFDSILPPGCAPDVLQLVFRDHIKCSSIAADGSDFTITGTSAVTVTGASGLCNNNGLTDIIQVTLSAPIQKAGSFQIKLQTGSDGNAIINECGKETPPGATIPFTTKDTVSAMFTANVHYGCLTDTVFYNHDGRNVVNSWAWTFDSTTSSNTQSNVITYAVFGQKNATLIVSNGTCSDTASAVIALNNSLKAGFESTPVVCPGDPASFIDNSTGLLNTQWFWNFGNGSTSNLQLPPAQYYPASSGTHDVPVQLVVTNSIGCKDTAVNPITVAGNCYIAVPKAFSPNGDGLNDYLYPTNAYKATNLMFKVYNRSGQLIFETGNWTNKWDGTFKGSPQDPGTYVWSLEYTNIDTGKKVSLKGTTVLIR